MSLASIGWKALDRGRRRRLPDIDSISAAVRRVYPTATKEGSTNGFSYWVEGSVVALAWPVARSPDWWYALAPAIQDPHPTRGKNERT